MLLIKCPVCGCEGDETDFHYGGEGHLTRPASEHPGNVGDGEHHDYLYVRKNPRGAHAERWLCERGCGKWFHALRDTLTMAISQTYLITDKLPATLESKPGKSRKKIEKRGEK